MATFVFDTHRAVKDLEEAGFAEAQAEALVEIVGAAIGESVATKADLDALEQRMGARIDASEQKLMAQIVAVEQKMTARIAALEQKQSFDIASVRKDLGNMENRVVLKLSGVILATGALVVAALRFIPV